MTDTDYTSDEPSTPENGFAVISPYRPLTRTAHNDLKDYGIIDTIDNTDQMNRGNGVRVETQPPIDLLENTNWNSITRQPSFTNPNAANRPSSSSFPKLVTSHGVETTTHLLKLCPCWKTATTGQSLKATPRASSTAIDILLRLKPEESRGWDIRVCSLPPVSAVGIRRTGHRGRLRAVPTSRYSYLHPNWVQTRSYFHR